MDSSYEEEGQARLERFRKFCDLQRVGDGAFISSGASAPEGARLHGGPLLALAVTAAGHTVEQPSLHFVSTDYLRGAVASKPIEWKVRNLRDSRSLSTRRVVGSQDGELIVEVTVSFASGWDGIHYQHSRLGTSEEPPTALEETWKLDGEAPDRRSAYPLNLNEMRRPSQYVKDGVPGSYYWARPMAELPNDPLLHAAAATFIAAFIRMPITGSDGKRMDSPLAIDATIWFHGPIDWNGWHLHRFRSEAAGGGRALIRGELFRADGQLLATTAQESTYR